MNRQDLRRELVAFVSRWVVPALLVLVIPLLYAVWATDRNRGDDIRRQAAIDAWARYDVNYAGCLRGQVIRAHIANLEEATRAENEILAAFLDTSVQFRQDAGQNVAAKQALQARNRIREIADGIVKIPPVVCLETITQPIVPRPKEVPPPNGAQ